MHEGIIEQEIELQDFVFGRMIVKAAARRIAEPYLGARTDQGVVRVRVEKRDLLRDPARIGKIVMVLPGDIAPSRQRNAAVERSRETHIFLMIDPHPGIGDLIEKLARAVGRAVVDGDQFEISERLLQDRYRAPEASPFRRCAPKARR